MGKENERLRYACILLAVNFVFGSLLWVRKIFENFRIGNMLETFISAFETDFGEKYKFVEFRKKELFVSRYNLG